MVVRKRIRSSTPASVGGGGEVVTGDAHVAWGPNFGAEFAPGITRAIGIHPSIDALMLAMTKAVGIANRLTHVHLDKSSTPTEVGIHSSLDLGVLYPDKGVGVHTNIDELDMAHTKDVGVHPNLDALSTTYNDQEVGVEATMPSLTMESTEAVGVQVHGDSSAVYDAQGVAVQLDLEALGLDNEQGVGVEHAMPHLSADYSPDGTFTARAWDIRTADPPSTFDVSTQLDLAIDFAFSPDGSMMFAFGKTAGIIDADAFRYDLSTPWDVSTAVHTQDTTGMPMGLVGENIFDMAISADVLYILTGSGIFQYPLSSPWDISTATSATRTTASFFGTGLAFSPDGFKMFLTNSSLDNVRAYNLSSAWDARTAVLAGTYSNVNEDTSVQDIYMRPDGLKMYLAGVGTRSILEYDLSVAFDVTTSTFLQKLPMFPTAQTTLAGVFLKSDGLRLYGVGDTTIYQMDLGVEYPNRGPGVYTVIDMPHLAMANEEAIGCQCTNPHNALAHTKSTGVHLSAEVLGAPIHIATTTASFSTLDNTADFVISKPTGAQVGDLLIVHLTSDAIPPGSGAVMQNESGWSTLGSQLSNGSHKSRVYYRLVDGTEGSTFTFDITDGSSDVPSIMAGSCHLIRGVNQTTPIDAATSSTGNAADPTAPGLTTLGINRMVFYANGHLHTAASTNTPPASNTETSDVESEPVNGIGETTGYRIFPTAAATGSVTINCSSLVAGTFVSWRFSVNPGPIVIAT